MKAIFKAINILLSIGLVFIAAGVAFVTIPYFGNQALIVRSGSMEPTIGIGSIVVARPGNELISPSALTPKYNAGDIIAFRSEKNSKTLITHRVVGVEPLKEGGVFYKTKGDANEEPDNWTVDEKNILGKMYFTLPYAGRILTFAKSDIGLPLLIIFPAALVIVLEVISIISHIKKNRRRLEDRHKDEFSLTPSVRDGFNMAGLKALIPLVAFIGLLIPISFAFPTDTETSTGNVFQASEVFPPPGQSPSGAAPTPTPSLTPTPKPGG